MDDATQVRHFRQGRFEVRVYLTKAAPGLFGGYVEVDEDDALKCRMVMARPLDRGHAIAELEFRCRAWCAARASGEPGGETQFADL